MMKGAFIQMVRGVVLSKPAPPITRPDAKAGNEGPFRRLAFLAAVLVG
jgi:hypothetical protein